MAAATNQAIQPAPLSQPHAVPPPVDDLLQQMHISRIHELSAAVDEVALCSRVVHKIRRNMIDEVIQGAPSVEKHQHYPTGDVIDRESWAQFYYHVHRDTPNEHGHFHTFLNAKNFPDHSTPLENTSTTKWPTGNSAFAHLVAISVNNYAQPIGLFTTNRWVTNEVMFPNAQVLAMLDRFVIDLCTPSWPLNRWISALLRLFRPQIEWLIMQRESTLQSWQQAHPEKSVYQDSRLEILSSYPVTIDEQVAAIGRALNYR